MRVMIKSWTNKPEEVDLAVFLTPSPYGEESGIAECAAARSRIACEVIGKILAVLCEKKLLNYEEACVIAEKDSGDIMGEPL